MNNLYEKIEHLCSEHGITPGKLCSEIGVRRSVLGDLKAGRKKGLSFDTLSRIANYFQIPLDTLQEDHIDVNKVISNAALAVSHRPTSEEQELNEYLEMLRTRPEMKMMFQLAKGATKEDVEKAVRVIEAMFGKDTKGD